MQNIMQSCHHCTRHIIAHAVDDPHYNLHCTTVRRSVPLLLFTIPGANYARMQLLVCAHTVAHVIHTLRLLADTCALC